MHQTDIIGLFLLLAALLGVVLAIALIIFYMVKRNNQLIKATSRELSILIIVGCMMACVVSVTFMFYPFESICVLRHTGFHIVVCIMYSPLLAKTVRVYRIFKASNQGTGRPRFTSNKVQLIFIGAVISIQV
jgi:cation transport ATPase